MKLRTVISLGGSLIVPQGIDSAYLKKFRGLILKYISKRQFFIIAGGGHTARHYRDGGSQTIQLSESDLHWLGIHATHLNAHLIRIIFGKHAHPAIADHKKMGFPSQSVVVSGGQTPGNTTDHVAVKFAKEYGAKEVLNLSTNILYDKDPGKFKNAKPIYHISWKKFRAMFPKTAAPGFHGPFDPIASRLAQKLKLRVVLLDGKNLKNLKNYLDGKKFVGTVIE